MHCRAAKNEKFQETFIAKSGKDRPKARLSWYHPDDTVSAASHCVECSDAYQLAKAPSHQMRGSLHRLSQAASLAIMLHSVCVIRAWQNQHLHFMKPASAPVRHCLVRWCCKVAIASNRCYLHVCSPVCFFDCYQSFLYGAGVLRPVWQRPSLFKHPSSGRPVLQMVPRGWWKMGLLEDIKYYAPFGIGKPKATVA